MCISHFKSKPEVTSFSEKGMLKDKLKASFLASSVYPSSEREGNVCTDLHCLGGVELEQVRSSCLEWQMLKFQQWTDRTL